jgi:peroxiredoxin
MYIFWFISILVLWALVLLMAWLLLGAVRVLALLRWRVAELEAITPSGVGRSGLRPSKKAPQFTLPNIAGGEIALEHYSGRKLRLVFMQAGCGPCHDIVPELNRLHDAGAVQVLVIHNGDTEAVRRWFNQNRPRFSVAVQDRFNLSGRYEVFATPFAFLIDERGVIAARCIVSTKQFLGFVLTRAGDDGKEGDREVEAFQVSRGLPAKGGDSSLSYSKEVNHV